MNVISKQGKWRLLAVFGITLIIATIFIVFQLRKDFFIDNLSDKSDPKIVLKKVKESFPQYFSGSEIKEGNAIFDMGKGLVVLENGVVINSNDIWPDKMDNGGRKEKEILNFVDIKVKEFLQYNGFSYSDKNSINKGGYASRGYELNNLKCRVEFLFSGYPMLINMSCGLLTSKAGQEFSEFLPINQYPHESYLIVTNKNDLYATGRDISLFPSGGVWLAKKENGVWKKIVGGQDYGLCSFYKSRNIPSEFYLLGGCLKDDGKTIECITQHCKNSVEDIRSQWVPP